MARKAAELTEKGGEKVWDLVARQRVVFWAPEDGGALARLLAALLRRSDPARRPAALRFVAPIPRLKGLSNTGGITDL
eukprot:3228234-Pyramimonas_sp.AAC.1